MGYCFKETDTDYHLKAEPTIASKLCPHCGCSIETVAHTQKTLFIRDLTSHGKSVAVHLDEPRLRLHLKISISAGYGVSREAGAIQIDSHKEV